MKNIEIKFKQNGYMVNFVGFLKNNGERVYKFTEEFKLLEDIGQAIVDKKVEVKEK